MIYLDNAATSFPKAPQVSKAVVQFLDNIGANSGRSSYNAARKSARIIYQTRELLAELLKVESSERICFTMNTTQALNIAIKGVIKPGMTVLTSNLEHNSVMRPLRDLEKKCGVTIRQFHVKNHKMDWLEWQKKLADKPDVVIITAASNVSGYILPAARLAREARQLTIPVILDAAQAVGTIPVKGNDFDIVCFPGHKGLLGPMGTGGLYVHPGLEMDSLFQGGTGSRSSEEFQPHQFPDKLESGTQNIPGIAGLKAALEYILKTGIAEINQRKKDAIKYLIKRLQEIEEIRIHSPVHSEENSGVIALTSAVLSISGIAFKLDRADIAIRMGLHCSPAAHKALGTFSQGGTIRLSSGLFTTRKEIDAVVEKLKEMHYEQ